jgi:hypothetical protein
MSSGKILEARASAIIESVSLHACAADSPIARGDRFLCSFISSTALFLLAVTLCSSDHDNNECQDYQYYGAVLLICRNLFCATSANELTRLCIIRKIRKAQSSVDWSTSRRRYPEGAISWGLCHSRATQVRERVHRIFIHVWRLFTDIGTQRMEIIGERRLYLARASKNLIKPNAQDSRAQLFIHFCWSASWLIFPLSLGNKF